MLGFHLRLLVGMQVRGGVHMHLLWPDYSPFSPCRKHGQPHPRLEIYYVRTTTSLTMEIENRKLFNGTREPIAREGGRRW
jgi:hypothetical protein